MNINTLLNNSWATLGVTSTITGDVKIAPVSEPSFDILDTTTGNYTSSLIRIKDGGFKFIWFTSNGFATLLYYSSIERIWQRIL